MKKHILRTRDEINREYSECAMKLGDAAFKIDLLENEIPKIKTKMDKLAKEEAASANSCAAILPKEDE